MGPITRRRASSLDRNNPNVQGRLPVSNDGDTFGADSAAQPSRMADTTMFSNESVQTIIASLQRSQTEAFQQLLDSVTRTNASTPSSMAQGTLTNCKASFSGQQRESVEAFIDAVEAYSECAQVTDLNILRGLAFLFKDDAATWWQGVKLHITTWSQAKENLISAYGDRRPPHRIYIEIFSSPQLEENTDVFVARIRSLFARLPEGDITERAQLDMTYGLLSNRIRKRVRREDFASFKELLRRARSVEDSFGKGERKSTPPQAPSRAVTSSQRAPHVSTVPPPPPPAATPMPMPAMAAPGAGSAMVDATTKKHRPVCAYCRRFGHSKDQCRKLMNQGESSSHNNSANVRSFSDTTQQSFYSVESQHRVPGAYLRFLRTRIMS
jgi:hypothetical protein